MAVMLCLKKGGTTAVRSSFMMPWTMRILMTCRKRQVFFDVGWQMPTNCFAAKQLSQFYKHSKSADLLCKSLLSHVWRGPSSKAYSCKHEYLLNFLPLASSLMNGGYETE